MFFSGHISQYAGGVPEEKEGRKEGNPLESSEKRESDFLEIYPFPSKDQGVLHFSPPPKGLSDSSVFELSKKCRKFGVKCSGSNLSLDGKEHLKRYFYLRRGRQAQ